MSEKLDEAASIFAPQSSLFMEYLAGLRRFAFMFQLKFAQWGCLPFSLLVLAHHDETTARTGARRILAEWDCMCASDREGAHVVCKSFLHQGGRVRASIMHFVKGASRHSDMCRPWRQEVARFAFLPLLERSIEGHHAVVKRATESAPNHSGAFVRSVLRMPALLTQVDRLPQMLTDLADNFSRIRLPVFVLKHLGLLQTPAVRALAELPSKKRDALLRSFGFVDRVMFRLDAEAQYADWEELFPGPWKATPARAKLPLQDADANSLQRHLAMEHFRATCSVAASSSSSLPEPFYAAALPLVPDLVRSASEFPFRGMRSALFAKQRVEACVDADGQLALFEPELDNSGAFASSAASWKHRVSNDLALNSAQDDRLDRRILFKVQV